MKNKIKTLLATAILGTATVMLYSGAGTAAANVTTSNITPVKHHHCRFHRHHGHRPWHLGLNRDKQLSENDARTIVQAALLMRGHHDLQVGKLETKITKHGRKLYLIDIVDQQNKTVRRVVLNSKNGHVFPAHANKA